MIISLSVQAIEIKNGFMEVVKLNTLVIIMA